MKKRIRIKDVAAKAGVSTGTVDRVIHNRGKVNPEVKKKVEKVMKELGFERNLIASALAKNQNFRFGVLLPEPEGDPYWFQLFAGVQKAGNLVKHYGVNLELHHFELLSPSSYFKAAKKMMKFPYDAILFPPLFLKEGEWLLRECKKKEIPNVMINTNIKNSDSLCYIGQDSYQSGVLAARLLSFGIKPKDTVMILSLTKGFTYAKHLIEKIQGFKEYFNSNGLEKIEIIVEEFEEFNNKRKLKSYLKKIIKQYPNLSRIFFTNSRAYFAVDCLEDNFLEKCIIAGFDLIEPNINYLNENKINFLINQNPLEQGYLGITNLYRHLVLKQSLQNIQYLPLDIVVKENIQYYLEREQFAHVI